MISRRLREFRTKNNLSQEGLAKVGNMTQRAWGGWEENPPKALESLVAIATHYNVSTDYLLGLTDNEMSTTEKLEPVIADLISAIHQLPLHRQADLLAIAEMFVARKTKDNTQLMNAVFAKIEEIGGDKASELIADLLRYLNTGTSPESNRLGLS